MGKYLEITRGAVGLIRSLIHPVYLIADLPREYESVGLHCPTTNSKKLSRHTLTLLSWNILRNYHAPEIETSLQSLSSRHKPEIIFLQEVPSYHNSSFWENEFCRQFHCCYAPMHHVRQQSSFYNFNRAGQLILSKYPLAKVEVYPLPSVTKPTLGKNHLIKRIALYAQIRHGKRTLGMYNLHLENITGPGGRKKQLQYLFSIITKNKDDLVILGGDFNTLFGAYLETGLSFLEQQGFQKICSAKHSFLPHLDYFFVQGCKAEGEEASGTGSDHQPLIAEITL